MPNVSAEVDAPTSKALSSSVTVPYSDGPTTVTTISVPITSSNNTVYNRICSNHGPHNWEALFKGVSVIYVGVSYPEDLSIRMKRNLERLNAIMSTDRTVGYILPLPIDTVQTLHIGTG